MRLYIKKYSPYNKENVHKLHEKNTAGVENMIKHHGETNNSLNPKNTNVELCLTRDKIYLVDDGWEMRNNNYFKKYNKINYSNKYAQSYNEDKNNNNFTITINKILNSLLNTIIRIFKKIKRKLWEWKIK